MFRLFRQLALRASAVNRLRIRPRPCLCVEELETRALLSGSPMIWSAAGLLTDPFLGPYSETLPRLNPAEVDQIRAVSNAGVSNVARAGSSLATTLLVNDPARGLSRSDFLWTRPADLPIQVADPKGDSRANRVKQVLGVAPPQGTPPGSEEQTSTNTTEYAQITRNRKIGGHKPLLSDDTWLSSPSATDASSSGLSPRPHGDALRNPQSAEPRAASADGVGSQPAELIGMPTGSLPNQRLSPEVGVEVKATAKAGVALSRPSPETPDAAVDSRFLASIAAPLLAVPLQGGLPAVLVAATVAASARAASGPQSRLVTDLSGMSDTILPAGGVLSAAPTFANHDLASSRWANLPVDARLGREFSQSHNPGSVGVREASSQPDVELPPADLGPVLSASEDRPATFGVEVQPLATAPDEAGTSSFAGGGNNMAEAARDVSLAGAPDGDLGLARDLLIAGAVVSFVIGSYWGVRSEKAQVPPGRWPRHRK